MKCTTNFAVQSRGRIDSEHMPLEEYDRKQEKKEGKAGKYVRII